MTEFATLSSINPTAPAIDRASVAGAGIANMAVFGDILAETVEAPSLAAAPPGVAPPLAIDDRQQAGGKILPEACPALPCGPTEPAGCPARLQLDRGGEVVANRGTVRAHRNSRTAVSASDIREPTRTAGEVDTTIASPAAKSDDPETDEFRPATGAVPEPRVPLIILAGLTSDPALPLAAADARRLPQAPSRSPLMPPIAVAIAAPGRATIDALSPLPATVGFAFPSALQAPVDARAAGGLVVPQLPAAPLDAAQTSATTLAQPAPFPASAAPGPVLRVTSLGVRAKELRNAAPSQTVIPALASLARREFDEFGVIAPLPATTQGVVLAQPNAILTPNPTTAPAPAAPQTRQDFVALVERLIDSRNALSPQPVHTAVAHTEFGEISFRFAHDERGLSVAMASADPDFAPAVQAAMPTERADRAPHDQSRGQPGSGQSPSAQGAVDDRGGNHAAPQSRAAPDRNARLAADPDPGSRQDDRPDRRAGIFA